MKTGEGGFSLVELLVTTAVLAVAMLLATRLLVVSQVELARTQVELLDPLPRYAETRLRRDLESATSVPALLPEWTSARLVLMTASGSRVVWNERQGVLERLEVRRDGASEPRQEVLHGVLSWRWRKAAPKLVDFEIRYSTRDLSGWAVPGAVATWTPAPVARVAWRRVLLHGLRGR